VSEIICVVTLVAYGCPLAVIVAAFERDEPLPVGYNRLAITWKGFITSKCVGRI
jgi:hypothetical protein